MNKKPVKKATKRVTATKQKPGRKPDLADIRVATRLTASERDRLHELAVLNRRTDSAYIRELVVKNLQENPPPE